MAQYGAAAALRPDPKPRWDFVTSASEAALAPVLAAYGQWVGRSADPSDPNAALPHVLRVYLIDRGKMIRNIYGVGFLDPRLLIADIRTLLLEPQ
jgi:cytochrome oxidase Cu insertion factor (SCO1/SenC/PrrC family)